MSSREFYYVNAVRDGNYIKMIRKESVTLRKGVNTLSDEHVTQVPQAVA